jgi:replicative DNA helicase
VLREAVNLKFDYDLGHDYFVDAAKRFEYYNKEDSKIPFRIAILDKVTNGGIGRKTLNIVVAGVNSGKTGFMCNLVANYIRQGLNVVYFSLEMAEEEIAKRIDANLMNIEMDKFTRGFDVNAGIR